MEDHLGLFMNCMLLKPIPLATLSIMLKIYWQDRGFGLLLADCSFDRGACVSNALVRRRCVLVTALRHIFYCQLIYDV
jgi:hypothetical protein